MLTETALGRLGIDAVGAYVARRDPVRRRLLERAATDSTASGRTRDILVRAANEYALVGDDETVRTRIETLRDAGVDRVVAYPAAGLSAVR